MPVVGTSVRLVLSRRDFRRLLLTRLFSQFGDGVFQAALAGTVLFNPQRAADPLDIAAGFAVLLLPYSLVGPFAGVWLDRWSRRQVLLRANVVRAGLVSVVAVLILGGVEGTGFYTAGLAVFSVNRLVLSALSAGLPHTTAELLLVPANALSTTAGGVSTVAGGAAAILALEATGSGDPGYALMALAAAVPYLVASVVVSGFSREHLGPDHMVAAHESVGATVRATLLGMVAGARHVAARPPAAAALLAIGLHRLCYGVFTLMTLLIYRNTFLDGGGLFPGGILGLGQVVAAAAAGTLLAALVTPPAVRRIGIRRWIPVALTGGAGAQVALAVWVTPGAVVLVGLLLGFVAQAVKICVDSTLQETVEDDYRGRVFSVYDTLFNMTFVLALVLGAVTLPESGVSALVPAVVASGYLVAAVTYLRLTRKH